MYIHYLIDIVYIRSITCLYTCMNIYIYIIYILYTLHILYKHIYTYMYILYIVSVQRGLAGAGL